MTAVLARFSPGGPTPDPPREDTTLPALPPAAPGPCPPEPSAIMLAAPRLDGLRPQERVSLAGMIREAGTGSAGGSPVYRCVLAYAGGELDLLFLGRATIAGLIVGTRCTVQGTVTVRCGRLAVWNPRYEVAP